MERRRRIPARDPFPDRCARVLNRAADRQHVLTFDLTGVCLSPGGVLALLTPRGTEPDEFRTTALGAELGGRRVA